MNAVFAQLDAVVGDRGHLVVRIRHGAPFPPFSILWMGRTHAIRTVASHTAVSFSGLRIECTAVIRPSSTVTK